MDKKLLLISPGQFGYLTDYYYYCKYLTQDFSITFLCFDEGLKKKVLPGVQIKYVPLKGNRVARYLRWLKYVIREVFQSDYHIIFTYSFKFCFLIKLLSGNKAMIMDIRTGSVKENPLINWLQNWQLRLESYFFDHITIISNGLIKHLDINPLKCHYLPLGAEKLQNSNSGYDSIKLLYVGTLNHRKLHETVIGFSKFYNKYHNKIECSYNIFGFGSPQEENLLRNTIDDLKLTEVVQFHGRKSFDEILDYYRESNIGVCYIPITPYFNFQPPTKTFEYILAGMVCIGTATYENSNLINDKNGILCKDSSDSFNEALEKYYQNRLNYKHDSIVNSLEHYTWDKIVNRNLKPYLNTFVSDA